jgi:hypothetical protein
MPIKKATLLFFSFLLLLTFSLSRVPGHNGDLPFYIAAVFSSHGSADEQAIKAAEAVIRTEMTADEAAAHLDRLEHAEKDKLDFYRIKPLYIYFIKVLHQCGVSFITATLIPSLLSFFLIGCLVFSWSARVFDPLPALIFSVLLLLINPSTILARLSSPDSLSNLFLFSSFYRIYFGKKWGWTILLLMISLFVRLDNVVTVLILLTTIKFSHTRYTEMRISGSAYLIALILAGLICVGVNFYFERNFWWFRQEAYLQSFRSYGRHILQYCLVVSQSLIMPLILFLFLAFFRSGQGLEKRGRDLLLSIGFIFFGRFLLFPQYEDRFATAFYLVGFLILLEWLMPFKTWKKPEPIG